MADEPQGRWSSEAFDILRVFRRVGRSFVGLLVLEIAWPMLLEVLARFAVKDAAGNQFLTFDWLLSSTGQPVTVSVQSIYTIGALLILLVWTYYSDLYQYLWVPITAVLKRLVVVSCYVAMAIVGVLNGLLELAFKLTGLSYSARRERRLRKKLDDKKIKREDFDKPQSDTHKSTRWIIEEELKREIPDRSWMLLRAGWQAVNNILAVIYSAGPIGFVPLVSRANSEDIPRDDSLWRIFLPAINQIKVQLPQIEVIERIAFPIVRPQFTVSTPRGAERLRWLRDLDVLIWGSYAADDPGILWLNIQRRPHRAALPAAKSAENVWWSKSADLARDARPLQFHAVPDLIAITRTPHITRGSLFPDKLDFGLTSIAVSPHDRREIYATALLLIMLVLTDHWERRQRRLSSVLGPILGTTYDRLAVDPLAQNAVMEHLAYDVFLSLPDRPLTRPSRFSAKVLLTEVVSEWVGQQLAFDRAFWPIERVDARQVRLLARQLLPVAAKCAQLLPDAPVYLYRLGAIHCLLGQRAAALCSFRAAGKLEKDFDQLNDDERRQRFVAFATAQDERDNPLAQSEELTWARFAAGVARGLLTLPSLAQPHRETEFWDRLDAKFTVIDEIRTAEVQRGSTWYEVEWTALSIIRELRAEARARREPQAPTSA